ncbi:Hypothetical protein CINCED_3A008131 [Cinara cedri]|uniref:Uncharacterized protein n=1 Tax=Cinara cedri TaxID=506608 RepID=A0A5E4N8N6_9HEMI|nr:Hypothetical protein CINCED_3A008131 [Cinara cedri]
MLMKAVAFVAAMACVLKVSHEFPFDVNKRNLDSLARTGQLPGLKRTLASLAKNGQLPNQLVNEKRMLDQLEVVSDANSKAIQEQKDRLAEEMKQFLQSEKLFKREQPTLEPVSEPISEFISEPISEHDFRNEFKSDLRNLLNQYFKKFGTSFDQEKVELFLSNVADEVFDNHGVVSLDHIRYLIETGYFQPEFQDGNSDKMESGDSSPDDYIEKRFMASLARTSNMPYWSDSPKAIAKRYISSLLRQGKLPYGFQPTTESSTKNPDWNLHRQGGQKPKRSDETYQNVEEFIPVMQGGRSLQSIIDDLAQGPIEKRYLGAGVPTFKKRKSAGTSRILGGHLKSMGNSGRRRQQQKGRKQTG